MIKLTDKWSILTDGTGATLQFQEVRKKDNKEKTEKVDYLFKDEWYFLSIKQCLNRYLQLELEDTTDVKSLLSKMEEVEKIILNVAKTIEA